MHVSSCAFPQLSFPTALRLEEEEWMVGKEEGCHALALDTKNFVTCKPIKNRGGQSLRSLLCCVPKVSTIFFLGEQWVNQMFP